MKPKVNPKAALKKLQEKLVAIVHPVAGDGSPSKVEIAFMSPISGALIRYQSGKIAKVGPQSVPDGSSSQSYIRYFIGALVALREISEDEGEAAMREMRARETRERRKIDLSIFKQHAKDYGYDLVKKPKREDE